ncbi:hypothetical protein GH741_00150 [Aquibacillus halophilus]|uniref:Uncharacterized protein n=1 Tax=Aquibacillus halophilus TaxID=930132 RepID=A0A6A8DIE2_9BACI|nr:hypothetical protein [Aquibacillus halophilus]MRH41082.1 hypothetical protein [Aquibacillus halophilus]
MNKHDPNNIERELRDFPTHKLSQSSQEKIHQNLMTSVQKVKKTKRREIVMKKVMIGTVSVAALVLFILLGVNTFFNTNQNTGEVDEEVNNPPQQEPEQQEPESSAVPEFDEEKAREIMTNYKQAFVSLTEARNSDGLITTFDSISEVHSHLSEVMSADLASRTIDSYVEEKDDGVYLIAKDAPTWLAEDTEFTVERVNDEHYKIIQERNNELIGHKELIFHSEWRDEKWIVSQIDSNNLESEEEEEELTIEEKAETIIQAIHNRNMESLAEQVHPEKGLLFSPYVFIQEDAVVFEKNQVATLLNDNEQYLWGHSDGSGEPIELTPNEYFDQFLDIEALLEPDEILVDQVKQRGNSINNLKEVFPESTVVEYYHSGTEEYDGMDWSSVNLVFEQDQNGSWKLVAIVKDQWTI